MAGVRGCGPSPRSTASQRLAAAAAGLAQGAVDGGSAARAGCIPIRASREQSVAQAPPTPDGRTRCPARARAGPAAPGAPAGRARRRGRTAAASSGSRASAGHERDREAADALARARARGAAAWAATTSTGSPGGDEVGDRARPGPRRARRARPRLAARRGRAAWHGHGSSGASSSASTPAAKSPARPTTLDRRRRAHGWRARGRRSARLDRPVERVGLQPHRDVDRLAGRGRAGSCRAPKRTARERAPPECEREGDVAALRPERPRVRRAGGRDEQRDRGVARAERLQPRQLLGERRAPSTSPGTTASTRSAGTRSSGRSTAAAWAWNASRNASTRVARDRQAGRGAVAAVAQQVAARRPAGRASRSNAGIERPEPVPVVAVEGDQHRRAVVALGDPRGDDADHARVPVLARPARRRARGAGLARPAPRPRTGCASRRRGARG